MGRDETECHRTCGECPSRPAAPGRRRALSLLCLAFGGAGVGLLATPAIGLFLLPLRRSRESAWRDIGNLENFAVGEMVRVVYEDPEPLPWAGVVAETAAWVRRTGEDSFVAFGSYCTHVGCPVRWVEGARLFLCPCHGGAFHEDGTVAAGPPPRPLPRLDVRVQGGRVEIATGAIQDALGATGRPPAEE